MGLAYTRMTCNDLLLWKCALFDKKKEEAKWILKVEEHLKNQKQNYKINMMSAGFMIHTQ